MKKSLLLTLACLVACGSTSLAEVRKYVCVGINRYDSPILTELRGAENDAVLIGRALSAYAGFASEQDGSFVLLSSETGERAATERNIMAKLRVLAGSLGPDDVFLFFFAGHGILRGEDTYLMARDSSPVHAEGAGMGIRADALGSLLGRIRARKRILMLDACRNDPLPSRSGSPAMNKAFVRGLKAMAPTQPPAEGKTAFTVTFYSCGVGERAFEWPHADPVQGFFSFFTARALEENSTAGKDLSIPGLVKYLESNVERTTKRVLGVPQVPWAEISGRHVDRFVLSAAPQANAMSLTLARPGVTREPVPTRESGTLRITTDPAKATLWVAGQKQRGRTPLTLDAMPPGKTVVTVRRSGFLPEVKEIVVEPGKTTTLDLQLREIQFRRPRVH